MSWFEVFLSVIDTNLNYVITMLQLGPSFDPFLWQLVILKIKDWVSREKTGVKSSFFRIFPKLKVQIVLKFFHELFFKW